ncbi:ribosomal protein s12/S23 domain-containing protein [Phthorimaea operculella]|nr:ribosomal protein s12/S23 domain-containing protein [Phthorimaea operculella]
MNIVIDNSIRTKEELYEKLSLWPQYQHIYTDGSKTDTGVSLAYYHSALKTGNGYKLPKTCSIFTAEAAAIQAALEYINNLNHSFLNGLLLVTCSSYTKMNLLRKSFALLTTGIRTQCRTNFSAPAAPTSTALSSWDPRGVISRAMASLAQMHKTGPHKKNRKSRNPLNGNPFAKGVVLKTLIKKPKKPNSANRKCVLVRLSNGKEMVAYIPGIGHNLQEHNIVLVRVGRLKDCPGVKLKCVRGKYDLPQVIKQKV